MTPDKVARSCFVAVASTVLLVACTGTGQAAPQRNYLVLEPCDPMEICSLCRNATGLIRATVRELHTPLIRDERVTDLSGAELGWVQTWLTPALLESIELVRGAGPAHPIYFPGKVASDGTSGDGPLRNVTLKGGARSPKPLYLFLHDHVEAQSTYVLGCGGIYWSEPQPDGGVRLVSTFSRYASSSGLGTSDFSEGEFAAEVDTHWGATSCPRVVRRDTGP